VPEPSISEAEVATGKLKRYKSQGADQIPAELIQVEGHVMPRSTNLLSRSGTKKNCPTSGVNCHIYSQKRVIKLTTNYRGISLLSTSHKILSFFSVS
jgi:hypothetical protein